MIGVQKRIRESQICDRGSKKGPERAKSVIGVTKMHQQQTRESQICDRGSKKGPERAKSVIGVAKMDPREPNL